MILVKIMGIPSHSRRMGQQMADEISAIGREIEVFEPMGAYVACSPEPLDLGDLKGIVVAICMGDYGLPEGGRNFGERIASVVRKYFEDIRIIWGLFRHQEITSRGIIEPSTATSAS